MPSGVMVPEFYNMLFTMHGTIMIFFVIMPLLIGTFGNFLIPLQIGYRDMAFPFLNMLSYWVFFASAVIMVVGLFFGGAGAGWTGYATLSVVPAAAPENTVGQTLWLISLIIFGASSIMGSLNYITTIINLRAPGMSFFRLPLSIWGLFITAILLLLATPVLAAGLAMALFDRTAGTSFFIPGGLIVSGNRLAGGGGTPLLWQHLFWFFGHPEVYIMILPAMGIASEILPVFSRKPIFGYRAMVLSMCAIAFLGFIVWGHHMFVSGMNPFLGSGFMVATMVIAVPSAVKTFNWLGTLWGGNIRFTPPMMNALAFVAMFVIGGLTGISIAAVPVDIYLHDTYWVVGHLHYVLFGGSLFGGFAAVYYWFPKMFGRMMNDRWGKIHTLLTFVFYNGFAFPMFALGVRGMPRRIYSYLDYTHLQDLQPVNIVISVSAFLLGTVQIIFLFNFFWGLFKGAKADRNPWQANTLEWVAAPSPPPHGNYETIPTIHRGPYEYGVPGLEQDWLPQNLPMEAAKSTSGRGTPGDGKKDGKGR
jgi:cytochrome c oxidase subunit 1